VLKLLADLYYKTSWNFNSSGKFKIQRQGNIDGSVN